MSSTSILIYTILTASVIYVFGYPAYREISILTGEKEKYENYLAMVQNVEIKKDELFTKFNQISKEDIQNINTVLPNNLDFVKLISHIDAVASRQGIKIDEISSRVVDSSVGESIENAAPPKPYQSSMISFSFEASYMGFNYFMTNLEKSLRILDIRSVKISTTDKGLYSYTVEFEVYWLKS